MHVLHVGRAKVLLANVTGVRFHARVGGRMSGQIPLRGEHLPAHCALVRSAVLLHVTVEVLLRQQPLVANAALELVLVQVHHLSVLVQGVVARVELAADIAHVLRAAVCPNVELQVPLHLETFAAVLAGELVVVRVPSDVMGLEVALRLGAVAALVAAVQQTRVDVLVDRTMSLQVAFVQEGLVARGTFERPMEAVLAGDVTENLSLLFERRLTDIAGVTTVVQLLVQIFLFIVRLLPGFVRAIGDIQ